MNTIPDKDDQELEKTYVGFKKLKQKLGQKGAKKPGALAAWIGRKKYGEKKFSELAAEDKTAKEAKIAKAEDKVYKYKTDAGHTG